MPEVLLVHDGETLTGTVGDAAVRLQLDVPNSRAGLHGTCLGHDVDGYWEIGSNFGNAAPAARFLGRLDAEPVALDARFHLDALTTLRFAELTGSVGERELRTRISPVDVPADAPTTVSIDGSYDGAEITLYASVGTGRVREGRIEGQIGGRVVRLVAAGPFDGRTVGGEYDAVPELFALLVGSLLYFP